MKIRYWNGKKIESLKGLAKDLNINHVTLMYRIDRSGWTGDKIMWNKKGFSTIADCSRYFNIPESTLRGRLKKGWNGDRVIWNGIGYGSKKILSEKLGIHYSRLCSLTKKGINSDSNLAQYKLEQKEHRKKTFNGKTFYSVKEIARYLNVSDQTVVYYRSKGIEKESELNPKINAVRFKGKVYSSMSKAARENDCCVEFVKKYGECIEQTTEEKLQARRNLFK